MYYLDKIQYKYLKFKFATSFGFLTKNKIKFVSQFGNICQLTI